MEALPILVKNMERKSEIRKRIINERQALSKAVKSNYDRIIADKIMNHPLFQQTKDIFCYIPIRSEVETGKIIEAAWKAGKNVAVPKVVSKTEIVFYYLNTYAQLKPGCFGVLEPFYGEIAVPDNACMIVPGSVFDKTCNRMGYGGGYYDRYLALHEKYQTIAVA